MEKGWKEVLMTAQQFEAEMAKGILKNNEINAVILNQHDSSYTTFGEYAVFVAEEDIHRAIELLKELKK
ncbi:MAG: DUF2007 domain-containing protein [Prolixibacteraceae bacterium]|nr:DUF2007 domain-containing protein [Prolixibacteraceae bacterium]